MPSAPVLQWADPLSLQLLFLSFSLSASFFSTASLLLAGYVRPLADPRSQIACTGMSDDFLGVLTVAIKLQG